MSIFDPAIIIIGPDRSGALFTLSSLDNQLVTTNTSLLELDRLRFELKYFMKIVFLQHPVPKNLFFESIGTTTTA